MFLLDEACIHQVDMKLLRSFGHKGYCRGPAEQIIDKVVDVLSSSTPPIGFFSHAPVYGGLQNNFTFLVVLLVCAVRTWKYGALFPPLCLGVARGVLAWILWEMTFHGDFWKKYSHFLWQGGLPSVCSSCAARTWKPGHHFYEFDEPGCVCDGRFFAVCTAIFALRPPHGVESRLSAEFLEPSMANSCWPSSAPLHN